MALEAQGGRTQYLNMPEVEMADGMCGGHKQVSQMMLRNIYDRQRAGALRATADGVTGNPILRANLTLSATPFAARKYYKNDLFNGTFGRMVFSYKDNFEHRHVDIFPLYALSKESRILYPIQIRIIASVLRPDEPNLPIQIDNQLRNYR